MSSEGSVANEQNAFQRQLKPSADIERLKETLDFGKIIGPAICVAHGYRKMKNIMHHGRLKYVLEELIVVNRPTSFDLKNPTLAGGMGVGVEALQYLAFPPKKHGNDYLVLDALPFLDSESEPLQPWAKPFHDAVARLVCLCGRIDSIGHRLKEPHNTEPEFRRR